MATSKKSLYEILGVPRDAMDLDIGLAHANRVKELQRAVPPDPGAQVLLHEAFEVLSNAKRRAAYDASLLTAAEKAAAKEQAQSPDLVLETDEETGNPAKKWIGPAIGAVLAIVVIGYFLMRGHDVPPPPPVVQAPPPPPPPPAPKPLTVAQVIPLAMKSAGRVMSYTMSGTAAPLGLALSVEPGTMVTTCHGIPAGSQIVVKMGPESHSATLDVTDEILDLCRFMVAGLAGPPFAIAPEEPRAGDAVFVVGANAAGDLAITQSTVKNLVATPGGKVLELSTPVAQGQSGGAVLDTFGRLVGITTTPHKYGNGLNVAMPASWLAQMRTRNAAAK
ncbi:MAG: trypsin-like peptidase domain-containing protein [Usitatibacter sp.]